ncbi:MAG: biotin--[acetyl-CoA-carboxylase] ligase [Bryobacteraceae bacterium]|jgi:BirA family transcriptional regulator, biotin operon repressor / biotin---[acetyl-CoA-carboxylase] ligase
MRPFDIPGRQVSFFESITSTMHEAAALAAAGCASGTAVVAEEQTAGQGRHGHTWHSEPGSGLYVSVVLRLSPQPLLTLALGLATAEAIARVTDLRPDLRWPNDIMLGEKKTAGILVQLVDTAAIAGIGINVNHPIFPPEIAHEATSLRLAAGHPHSREDLLRTLLPTIDSFCRMLVEGGPKPILDLFEQHSTYARGKRVQIDQPGGIITGTTAGLDPNGFLKLRTDDGRETLILAGGVRPI